MEPLLKIGILFLRWQKESLGFCFCWVFSSWNYRTIGSANLDFYVSTTKFSTRCKTSPRQKRRPQRAIWRNFDEHATCLQVFLLALPPHLRWSPHAHADLRQILGSHDHWCHQSSGQSDSSEHGSSCFRDSKQVVQKWRKKQPPCFLIGKGNKLTFITLNIDWINRSRLT